MPKKKISTTIKKLVKHNDGKALFLDWHILKLLDIDEKTILVEIKINGTSLTVTSTKEKTGNSRFVSNNTKIQQSYEKISKKYAKALAKLAKN